MPNILSTLFALIVQGRMGFLYSLVRLLKMSCVLRISVPNVEAALQSLSISPYRVENGTAHFDVSDASFDNFNGQIEDAITFLSANGTDVKRLMSKSNASGGLDFGIDWRNVVAQFDTLPAALVRLAGEVSN